MAVAPVAVCTTSPRLGMPVTPGRVLMGVEWMKQEGPL